MGIFKKKNKEKRTQKLTLKQFYKILYSSSNDIYVDEENSMNFSHIYKCVKIISESIAILPLHVYEKKEAGRVKSSHNLDDLLNVAPNQEMTAFSYKETILVHLLTWGFHASEITIDYNGNVNGLYPLNPNLFRIDYDKKNKKIQYIYDNKIMPKWKILYIPGLSVDGITPLSPVGVVREAIEIGKATENFISKFYKNGVHTNGVLETDKSFNGMGDKQYQRLKESFAEKYQGMKNTGKPIILEEGMKFKSLTMPLKDAEFIATRKYQLLDIASSYRIPPHKVGNLEDATFSNIEQQNMEFTTDTLLPWAIRIQSALNNKLFCSYEKGKFYFEFDFNILQKADIDSRYKAYRTAINNGFMSINEIREKENMNTIENGDIHLIPHNLQKLENVLNQGEKKNG